MDIIYSAFFYIIAFVLLVSAIGVIFLPRIMYSAISLVVSFLAVAGIFVLLNADFLAVSQVIIYTVGIAILMIFAIMFTGNEADKKLWIALAPRTLFSLPLVGLLFILIVGACTTGFKSFFIDNNIFNIDNLSIAAARNMELIQQEGTTGIIGNSLLTKYVLPFELLSILLLGVVFAAVVIAKKENDNLINPADKEDCCVGEES